MEIIRKSVFDYEPEKTILAFIDLKAHLSGDLMKGIEFVSPKTIEALKEKIASNGNKIGDVFYIRDGDFAFITVRKHYNSKINKTQFKEILANLKPNKVYKTTNENFEEYLEVIQENKESLPYEVQIYKTSKWKERNIK